VFANKVDEITFGRRELFGSALASVKSPASPTPGVTSSAAVLGTGNLSTGN